MAFKIGSIFFRAHQVEDLRDPLHGLADRRLAVAPVEPPSQAHVLERIEARAVDRGARRAESGQVRRPDDGLGIQMPLRCTQPLALLRRENQPQPGTVIERRMEVAALEHGALLRGIVQTGLQALTVRSQQKREFHFTDAVIGA